MSGIDDGYRATGGGIDANRKGAHARAGEAEIGIARNPRQDIFPHRFPLCGDILVWNLGKNDLRPARNAGEPLPAGLRVAVRVEDAQLSAVDEAGDVVGRT